MQPNPTVTITALIAKCKGAGLDVSDAERMADRLQAMRDRSINGFALAHGNTLYASECTRAAFNDCIVAAMRCGYCFERPDETYDEWICTDPELSPGFGPTPADALYAALGGNNGR